MERIKRWFLNLKHIKKFRERKQFKKDVKEWLKLCKPWKKHGITKVGELTHKIEVDGLIIETNNPIFVKEEINA